MDLTLITPVMLCSNEQENLPRSLAALTRFPRVILLDSGSTDASRSIAAQFANVEWHERTFDQHAQQWQHGLSLAHTDWVLSLDADYVLPERLQDEIVAIVKMPDVAEKLASHQTYPAGNTAEEFAKIIARELVQWREVARRANIKID